MVLEATVIVIDNSEWMRNGDYTPTRIEAQADAVTLLFNAKTQSNPENTVGLMTMAGKGYEIIFGPSNAAQSRSFGYFEYRNWQNIDSVAQCQDWRCRKPVNGTSNCSGTHFRVFARFNRLARSETSSKQESETAHHCIRR